MGAPIGNKNAAGNHRQKGHSKKSESKRKKGFEANKALLTKKYGKAAVDRAFSDTFQSKKQQKRFRW